MTVLEVREAVRPGADPVRVVDGADGEWVLVGEDRRLLNARQVAEVDRELHGRGLAPVDREDGQVTPAPVTDDHRVPKQLPVDSTAAPRISEDSYTVVDAVVVGSLLITLLRQA